MTVHVTAPTPEDWPVLGHIHAEGLPHGFFAQLGPRFLVAYLHTFGDGPLGVARVARDGDRVVGFVVGSVRASAHSAWVVRHRGLRLATVGLLALLRHPAAMRTFLQTRLGRYAKGIWRRVAPRRGPARALPVPAGRAAPPREDGADVAVLRHVVVDRAARGGGVGGRLVDAFTDELRRRGTEHARLITRADEGGAAGLYERLGWTCVRSREAADGTFVREYAIDLR